ncbi:MAG: hypothetical protein AAF004_06755, partial [Pseudomonadota bacterium]
IDKKFASLMAMALSKLIQRTLLTASTAFSSWLVAGRIWPTGKWLTKPAHSERGCNMLKICGAKL